MKTQEQVQEALRVVKANPPSEAHGALGEFAASLIETTLEWVQDGDISFIFQNLVDGLSEIEAKKRATEVQH